MIQKNCWNGLCFQTQHDSLAIFHVEIPAPKETLVNTCCGKHMENDCKAINT